MRPGARNKSPGAIQQPPQDTWGPEVWTPPAPNREQGSSRRETASIRASGGSSRSRAPLRLEQCREHMGRTTPFRRQPTACQNGSRQSAWYAPFFLGFHSRQIVNFRGAPQLPPVRRRGGELEARDGGEARRAEEARRRPGGAAKPGAGPPEYTLSPHISPSLALAICARKNTPTPSSPKASPCRSCVT